MDIRFAHQDLIDISKIVDECDEKWFNQTLTKINNSVARIGVVEGEMCSLQYRYLIRLHSCLSPIPDDEPST